MNELHMCTTAETACKVTAEKRDAGRRERGARITRERGEREERREWEWRCK